MGYELRILHLPIAAGNQAWGLSRAERKLGHESDVVVFESNTYQMNADKILFYPDDGVLKRELKRWQFFLVAIFKYDRFHFHFGQKFFHLFPRPFKKGDTFSQAVLRLLYWLYSQPVQHFDTAILWLLRKPTFMTFHGDDLRQGDRSKSMYDICVATEVDETYYDSYSDARKRRMVKYFKMTCKHLYVVSPDLLDMGPKSLQWIPFTGVDPSAISPPHSLSSKSPPRLTIAHAPTHRAAKGTKYVLNAIETLKREGFELDFLLIEGVTHAEAITLYRSADLVIDQLLAGWFGVFSLELAAIGKPVICYIRPESAANVPENYRSDMPFIQATPNSITDVLRDLMLNPEALKAAGEKGRTFALKHHDPIKIASAVIQTYAD